MTTTLHVPVLKNEVLHALALALGAIVVDGTVGDGGHAEAILEKTSPDGKLLGLDLDPDALETSARRLKRFGARVMLRQGNFRDLVEILKVAQFPKPHAVLLDLGLRSFELEGSGRGFSFRGSEPLDMRFDPTGEITAADIVNGMRAPELERIFRAYGEEREARRIAERIFTARRKQRIQTTDQLVAIVGGRGGRIHPATRVFQALRIAVNDELAALEQGITGAIQSLSPKGRLAIISFHSLEDRIVKRAFLKLAQAGAGTVVTKRPLVPGSEEVERNPRSRSAKLRVFQKNMPGSDASRVSRQSK